MKGDVYNVYKVTLSPVLFRLSVKYNCRLNVVENDRLSHFKESNKEPDNVGFLNFVSTTSTILFVLIQPSAFLNFFSQVSGTYFILDLT